MAPLAGSAGTRPGTGLALTLRTGRFGRYVQRGEDGKDPQAARGTVPKGIEAHEITPEVARALLALPRTVGTHPETGKDIYALPAFFIMPSDTAHSYGIPPPARG